MFHATRLSPSKINCGSTCFIEWTLDVWLLKLIWDHQSSYSPRWFLFFIFRIGMLRTFSISLEGRILQLIILVWAHGFSGPIDAFLFSGTNWIRIPRSPLFVFKMQSYHTSIPKWQFRPINKPAQCAYQIRFLSKFNFN